jgi:putative membrane protein
MIYRLLSTLGLNLAGLVMAAALFTGVEMNGYLGAVLAAMLLTLLHLVVRPLLILLTLPFTILSLGLFLLVINGLMFWWAGSVLEGYQVHDFGSAVGGALVVSALGLLGGRRPWRPRRPGRQTASEFKAAGAGTGSFYRQERGNVVDLEPDESGEWKIKN